MKKVFLLLSILVSIGVGVSSCAQPAPAPAPAPPAPTPAPQEKQTFRVEVSRYGFNNTPGEFRLEVEEGQEVEITFVYGDGDFPQPNPHNIVIPDYGIDVGISGENPEVTVSFIASEAGVVAFICNLVTCVGHTNLQGGSIVIKPGG